MPCAVRPSLDDMWRVFGVYVCTHQNCGHSWRSLLDDHHARGLSATFSYLFGTWSIRAGSSSSYTPHSQNLYVINVYPTAGTDMFEKLYQTWALGSEEHWLTFFTV